MFDENINIETKNKVQELVRFCFEANSKMDVIVNRLDVVFNLPKTSDIIHQKIAHAYPVIFADKITDFLSKRNIKVSYGNIPLQNSEYKEISDCFKEMILIQNNIENKTVECIDIAEDNNDVAIKIFLENFLVDTVILYTKQANILYNSALKFEDDGIISSFDNIIDSLIII